MDATSYASFWAFVALVIFLGIMIYLRVPQKMMAALDTRAAQIAKTIADAEQLRRDAAALLADYRAKTANAEAEAAAILTEAKAEAERLTAETSKALEEMIARRTRAAEAKISQAETQAIAEVRARAAEVAIAAATEILTAKTHGEAANGLILHGIAEVGAKLN